MFFPAFQGFLGSFDIIRFVFDIMLSFFKFPVNIPGFIQLADAGFKNKRIMNACIPFSLDNAVKPDTSVGKMTDNRYIIFFLPSLIDCFGIHFLIFFLLTVF